MQKTIESKGDFMTDIVGIFKCKSSWKIYKISQVGSKHCNDFETWNMWILKWKNINEYLTIDLVVWLLIIKCGSLWNTLSFEKY